MLAPAAGNYKWGYTDLWCNMTTAGGPDGCRALILTVIIVLQDGSQRILRSTAAEWTSAAGPVAWDHFFHGETYARAAYLVGGRHRGRLYLAWHMLGVVCAPCIAHVAWRMAHASFRVQVRRAC